MAGLSSFHHGWRVDCTLCNWQLIYYSMRDEHFADCNECYFLDDDDALLVIVKTFSKWMFRQNHFNPHICLDDTTMD